MDDRLNLPRLWRGYVRTYSGLPPGAWLLAFVQLVNTSGTMVIFFLSLYLGRVLGFPLATAGVAMSAYGVGMLGGTLAGGHLADRWGARRVQLASLTSSAFLLLILPDFRSLTGILACTAVWGFCAAALWPANAAAMASVCPDEKRAQGFVLNRLANNLGASIGPVVGGLLAQHDYRWLFWVDGATCLLAALLLAVFFRPGGDRAPAEAPQAPQDEPLLRDPVLRRLLAAALLTGLIFAQVFSTYGPYLRAEHGLTEAGIGRLLALNCLMIVVLQMPLTHWAERHDRARVTALGILLIGTSFAALPFGRGALFLAATAGVWSFGEMLTIPTLSTQTSFRAPEHQTGRVMGYHSLAFSLGMTIGPAVGSRLLQGWGGLGLWGAVAGLSLAMAALMLRVARRVRAEGRA